MTIGEIKKFLDHLLTIEDAEEVNKEIERFSSNPKTSWEEAEFVDYFASILFLVKKDTMLYRQALYQIETNYPKFKDLIESEFSEYGINEKILKETIKRKIKEIENEILQ
ncbi:hypothetical protein [Persephonella sp. KM09-Lau-8]|uniref:hypothetical protein n=1 Tax=Persephonella sp. KM09-Lau-8 TaxID=1158345 RepID=UPI0004982210|nr:hypothetical protein [Persephonella sp. KM09-Lau-8]